MTDNVALLNADLQNRHLDQLRRDAIRNTVTDLKAGDFDGALQRITGSVLGEQARVAGIRVMPAEEVCGHGFWRSTCGEAHR